jgi:hypothetical protein
VSDGTRNITYVSLYTQRMDSVKLLWVLSYLPSIKARDCTAMIYSLRNVTDIRAAYLNT